jgi:DNA-binding beta-propeller fold protein YncE
MRRLAALLALLLVACGCSARERLNPFDPGNPRTGGRPAGFAAYAGYSQVQLKWLSSSSPGLLGFEAYRLLEGDTGYVAITGLLPPGTASFTDFGLLNGTAHHYRLYFVFDWGRSQPVEDVATPGPLRPWVADFGTDQVVRLTADGRHVAERVSLGAGSGPVDVAVDPFDGRVWACAFDDGSLTIYRPSDQTRVHVTTSVSRPLAVALDLRAHFGWVVDNLQDAVIPFDVGGNIALPGAIGTLDDPVDVAVDPTSGAVLVCEQFGGRVRRFFASGSPQWAATMSRPSRIAVDSVTSDAWVTSFENAQVVHLTPGGTQLAALGGFQGPIGIAVDARRRRVWVADAAAGSLVALHLDGSVEFRVLNLPEVREVAVEDATGNAWATLPGRGEVAIVAPTGTELRRLTGLSAPYGIALDNVLGRDPGLTASRATRAR